MASSSCPGLMASAVASSSRAASGAVANARSRSLSTLTASAAAVSPSGAKTRGGRKSLPNVSCARTCVANSGSSKGSAAGHCWSTGARARQLHSSALSSAPAADAPRGSLPAFARRQPQLYAAVQPPPTSAVAALAARLKLLGPKTSAEEQERRIRLVAQACTHPSFAAVIQRARAAQEVLGGASAAGDIGVDLSAEIAHNAQLEAVGNSLLGLLGSEALHLKYPHLPTRVLKAALSAYVGPNTTADVGSEFGLAAPGMIRWDRGEGPGVPPATPRKSAQTGLKTNPVRRPADAISSKDARSSAVKALIGLIYQEKGIEAVKDILHTRFLSRSIDLAGMLKFDDPKRVLSSTCAKYGREHPQSRMIAETGRLSNTPLFVVGVYSGELKLGEGFGSSIRMAEYRAAEDALRRLYLAEAPFDPANLPSATLQSAAPSYSAPPLGASEVLHGSSRA